MHYLDVTDIVIGLDWHDICSVFIHVGMVAFGIGAHTVVVSTHHIALTKLLGCLLYLFTS